MVLTEDALQVSVAARQCQLAPERHDEFQLLTYLSAQDPRGVGAGDSREPGKNRFLASLRHRHALFFGSEWSVMKEMKVFSCFLAK